MPELPEVEVMRQGLIKSILNKRVNWCEVHYPKIISGNGTTRQASDFKTKEFVSGVTGSEFIGVKRFGKNLFLELSTGFEISVHLKMTGNFTYHDNISEYCKSKHEHVTFGLVDNSGNESVLAYDDIRKFGYLLFKEKKIDDKHKFLIDGIDTDLEAEISHSLIEKIYNSYQKTNKSIKKVMLDQKPITGIGNIYADEICFACNILPTKKAKDLTKNQVTNLLNKTKKILELSIKKGGSSISDYKHIDGTRGSYSKFHNVYGRGGLPCTICNTTLTKIKEAGRATVFCSVCQK
jgi:formamidopyrimidine-DNA glycosylase